jgi:hypothetical protein
VPTEFDPGTADSPGRRTPRSVINEARRDSSAWEGLCWYGFIAGGVVGLVVLVAGAFRGDAWVGFTSAIPGVLCWRLMASAMKIRRENVALRLLEVSLNNVTTAEQAATVISQAFGFHFGSSRGTGDVVPQTRPGA